VGQVKPKCLSPNQISELVWDSKSDEALAPSNSSSEDKGGFLDKPGVSHQQLDRPTSSDQASSSLISSTASDEEEVFRRASQQLFRLFNWTPLCKIGATAGHKRTRN